MRHAYRIPGRYYSLRPIEDSDAAAVVELRTNPERTRFLPPLNGGVTEQLAWLAGYYQRPGDYYFTVVRTDEIEGEPYGFVSVYDVNPENGVAEWGRVILKRGTLAFPETVLLSYRFAFEILGLRRLLIRTIVDNARPVAFHDACGLKRIVVEENAFSIHGRSYDAVCHCLDADAWSAVEVYLNQRVDENIAVLLGK